MYAPSRKRVNFDKWESRRKFGAVLGPISGPAIDMILRGNEAIRNPIIATEITRHHQVLLDFRTGSNASVATGEGTLSKMNLCDLLTPFISDVLADYRITEGDTVNVPTSGSVHADNGLFTDAEHGYKKYMIIATKHTFYLQNDELFDVYFYWRVDRANVFTDEDETRSSQTCLSWPDALHSDNIHIENMNEKWPGVIMVRVPGRGLNAAETGGIDLPVTARQRTFVVRQDLSDIRSITAGHKSWDKCNNSGTAVGGTVVAPASGAAIFSAFGFVPCDDAKLLTPGSTNSKLAKLCCIRDIIIENKVIWWDPIIQVAHA